MNDAFVFDSWRDQSFRFSLPTVTWASVRWKLRQKYSQFRSLIGGGRFVWQVEPNIRFVARRNDAFSHVLFVCRGHETLELQWCRRWLEPGDSLIDCGANIGYFSAYLAQAVPLGRVLAVEGNHRTAGVCSSNLALLGITNASVIEAILAANELEKLVIPDVRNREPWQRAVRAQNQSSAKVTTLDHLVESYGVNASLIKIDCEGYEPFILQGARRLLQAQRPALMIECNDDSLNAANSSRAELFSILRENNYETFHLASFGSFHPPCLPCDETFPAREFNFAAIPGNPDSLQKWRSTSAALLASIRS